MRALFSQSTALATAILLCVAHNPVLAQGDYSPVDEEDVLAMRLNHYFTPEKQGREADFEWRFFKDGFVIRSAKGSIPTDLRDKLITKGATAEEIQGKWQVTAKEGRQLVLSEIRVGKKPADKSGKKVSFNIYRTAPTVVRVGQPQYVFGIGP